jgi:hypothetical protein
VWRISLLSRLTSKLKVLEQGVWKCSAPTCTAAVRCFCAPAPAGGFHMLLSSGTRTRPPCTYTHVGARAAMLQRDQAGAAFLAETRRFSSRIKPRATLAKQIDALGLANPSLSHVGTRPFFASPRFISSLQFMSTAAQRRFAVVNIRE